MSDWPETHLFVFVLVLLLVLVLVLEMKGKFEDEDENDDEEDCLPPVSSQPLMRSEAVIERKFVS